MGLNYIIILLFSWNIDPNWFGLFRSKRIRTFIYYNICMIFFSYVRSNLTHKNHLNAPNIHNIKIRFDKRGKF